MIAVDEIDLARLAHELSEAMGPRGAEGYLRGKTALRDALVERIGCSALEAEELVDTMELRGFLRFEGDPSSRAQADAVWTVDPHDAD